MQPRAAQHAQQRTESARSEHPKPPTRLSEKCFPQSFDIANFMNPVSILSDWLEVVIKNRYLPYIQVPAGYS